MLRIRLFGIGLQTSLLFWVLGGLLGYMVISHMVAFNAKLREHWLGLMAVWLVCYLVGFVTHELGSAIFARLFGTRPTMVLGMGSTTVVDLDGMSLWKRILVHLAGPAMGLGCYALVVAAEKYVHTLPVEWRENRWVLQPIFFLKLLTFWYNLISLLPLLPMNGGKVLMEIGLAISPAKGIWWAYGWSFLCCLSIVVHAIRHWNDEALDLPLGLNGDPRFTTFLFGFFGVTNLAAFIRTWPPRPARRESHEVVDQDAVSA